MSRKGNCWDNAVAESFFATLRAELLDHEYYATRRVAVAGATGIATSSDHACAQVGGGGFVCWGSDEYGQLGDGKNARSSGPVPVQL